MNVAEKLLNLADTLDPMEGTKLIELKLTIESCPALAYRLRRAAITAQDAEAQKVADEAQAKLSECTRLSNLLGSAESVADLREFLELDLNLDQETRATTCWWTCDDTVKKGLRRLMEQQQSHTTQKS
ncbi:hypothetical protein Pelo_15633 [Pelomyxa schiedti]|nr:hypothetical protein Pelo_15633 [Pelomyxa schiedti]